MYTVVLDGKVLPGFDPTVVRAQLAKLIGKDEGVAGQLLDGGARKIKANLDQATGLRYTKAFRAIGVSCDLQADVLPVDLESAVPTPTAAAAGPQLGPQERFCSACAHIVHQDAELCPKCGVRLRAAPAAPQAVRVVANPRSRTVAAVLALFLGGLGMHKFYIGKVSGLWYLLFCWTFIPLIIAFVDGIRYLMMSDERFATEIVGEPPSGAASSGTASSRPGFSVKRIAIGCGVFAAAIAILVAIPRHESDTSAVSVGARKPVAQPVAQPAATLKPVLTVSRNAVTSLGHITTPHGEVEVSGQYAPNSDKLVVVFNPPIPLDSSAPRFFPELAELIYGVRPSSTLTEVGDGQTLIMGDVPRQFLLINAKSGERIVGAGISPR